MDAFLIPDHGVTVVAVAHAFHRDHARAPEILAAPALAEFWRNWACSAAHKAR